MNQINLSNKIYYPSEMQMSELVDNSMLKVKELTEAMLDNKNENVLDALQEIVEAERQSVLFVIDLYDIH